MIEIIVGLMFFSVLCLFAGTACGLILGALFEEEIMAFINEWIP